jgi:hypothetical protein
MLEFLLLVLRLHTVLQYCTYRYMCFRRSAMSKQMPLDPSERSTNIPNTRAVIA